MASTAATLRVVVACSPAPRTVDLVTLELPPGATVRDALAASGLAQRHPELAWSADDVAVWGQRRPLDAPLREGDRVEVLRPLLIDPKEARRRRQQRQAAAGRGGRAGR